MQNREYSVVSNTKHDIYGSTANIIWNFWEGLSRITMLAMKFHTIIEGLGEVVHGEGGGYFGHVNCNYFYLFVGHCGIQPKPFLPTWNFHGFAGGNIHDGWTLHNIFCIHISVAGVGDGSGRAATVKEAQFPFSFRSFYVL